MVYIEPRFADARTYYRDQYRLVHEHIVSKTLTAAERWPIQYAFNQDAAKEFMATVPEGASVLEVGCSAGGFLGHLAGKYDLYGNEWNPEDAAYVRETGGIPCEEGTLDEVFSGRKFTAIAALAVLEHQVDPVAFIRQCRERLIGGGWLYLEVPNLRDALMSHYQLESFANFYYREPHITYWTVETLAALMNTLGFEARISLKQKYTLHNHINWILNGVPMDDPIMARKVLQPVPKTHPGAAALNRIWSQIEAEYKVQMETLHVSDTLRCIARRVQI